MRIALISDAFPPMRTSGAVQMRDLVDEFVRQGHEPTVLIPDAGLSRSMSIEASPQAQIVRLKSPRSKDVGYARRTVAELAMPFAMRYNLRKSPLSRDRWDGIVWYSPTIFLGPLAKSLKEKSGCRAYLIVRDIFPDWAVDMGLMSRGLAYHFFKAVEHYQYSVADVIGVQTASNVEHFRHLKRGNQRIEVLQNWLAEEPQRGCSIAVARTPLAGRRIFVYAGNMGVAQGIGILLDLAESLRHRTDIGFVFVGRGSDAERLRSDAQARGLTNTLFFAEIDPSEIPALYAQCQIGLVSLDERHKTHNIPGKFLSYMHCGLPAFAIVNPSNDLIRLINDESVGTATAERTIPELRRLAETLIDGISADTAIRSRCKALAKRLFSPEAAVRQIVSGLSSPG